MDEIIILGQKAKIIDTNEVNDYVYRSVSFDDNKLSICTRSNKNTCIIELCIDDFVMPMKPKIGNKLLTRDEFLDCPIPFLYKEKGLLVKDAATDKYYMEASLVPQMLERIEKFGSGGGLDWGYTQEAVLTISGLINVSEGAILGGFAMDNDKFESLATTSGINNIRLNGDDGSGHLAAGNIIWDAIGNLLISGKFESNANGNRIIIDPITRTFKMLNSDNKDIFILSFTTETHGGVEYNAPKLVMNHWVGNEIAYWYELTGYDVQFFDKYGNKSYMNPTSVGAFDTSENRKWGFSYGWDSLNNCLLLSASNLPTSPNGLLPNQIYRDGNTLKIVN